MENKLPQFLDCPEKQIVITSLIYSFVCFFSFPFLLLLTSIGLHEDLSALSWIEIVFHVFNFLVVIKLFREYLTDSLIALQVNREQVISAAAIVAGGLLAMAVIWYGIYFLTGNDLFYIAAYGTIPISEMDILTLSSFMVIGKPFLGTVCMVVLVPVITGCLYYAVGFCGTYNIRPWLGYLTVALLIAFPRICNGVTYWDPQEQLVLYLAQLPVHLLSCWAYQKTDTVWTPIIAHMITNLIGCLVIIFLYAI